MFRFVTKRKRGVTFLLLLSMFFSLIPKPAFAHDAVFLQALIDKNNMQYQVNVVNDKANLWNLESKHLEAQLGDFSSLIKDNEVEVPIDRYDESSTDGSKEMPFTFPAKEIGGVFSSKEKNNATKQDIERAYLIKETLAPGLNDALRILNGGKPFNSVDALMRMGHKLSRGGQIGDYEVTYGKRASYSNKSSKLDKKTGVSSSDYVLIQNTKNPKEEYEFVYRVPKGYSKKGSWDNDLYNPDLTGDAKYITWHMLMYQAHYAYVAKGWTTKNINEINRVGALEEALVDLFQSAFNAIRNLLGLYDTNELIFNEGVRGSALWHYGAIPKSWESNVVTYHWVFQGLAWSLIAFAIIKQLIQKNLSTINPAMRVSLMQSIQNLIIAGFLLASIFPLVNLFLFLNAKLVDVFAALVPNFKDLTEVNSYSDALGGIIIQFFYFFVSLYLNALYVIRSVSISLLIAMSPLFVLTLALGPKWSPLFGTWMRELVANIFIQSFHAFILSFFAIVSLSTRGIEALIVYFSMIPLTEFFRQLILGEKGMASRLGMQSLVAGAGMVGGAASAFKGSSRSTTKSSSRSGESEESVAMGMKLGQPGGSRYDYTTSGKGASYVGAGKDQVGTYVQTKAIQDQHEIPLDVYTKGIQQAGQNSQLSYQGTSMSGVEAGMKDLKTGLKQAVSPSNIGKIAMGATSFASGVGMTMATGGSSPLGMAKGVSMVSDGVSNITSGIGKAGSSLKAGVQSLYQGVSMDMPAPDTQTKPDDSSFLSSYTHLRKGGNDQVYVYRDGSVLSQAGIVRGSSDDKGNAVFVYDVNKLNATDRANIETYAKLYQQDEQARAWLRAQGIERVSMTPQGHYAVAYNQVGKESIGIRDVRMVGGQMMETKSSYQPMFTKKTIDLPPYSSSSNNGNNKGVV